jgi:S1-C subfamily serine protease
MNTCSLWFAPLVGIVSIVFGYFLAARFLPALTSTPTASVVSSLETVVAQTSSAVVSVRTDIANLADPEMRGAGTAFHIGDGYFVTAAHVVDGGSKIYLDNRPRTVQHLENTEVATLVGKVVARQSLANQTRVGKPSQQSRRTLSGDWQSFCSSAAQCHGWRNFWGG